MSVLISNCFKSLLVNGHPGGKLRFNQFSARIYCSRILAVSDLLPKFSENKNPFQISEYRFLVKSTKI